MHALWRRIAFSILISNTDDHLRNHGFLWAGAAGWRLSPAYDLNPVPTDIKPRVLATAIDLDDGTASLQLAYDVAAYFELTAEEARAIAREVGAAVCSWRKEAERMGLTKPEIERMACARLGGQADSGTSLGPFQNRPRTNVRPVHRDGNVLRGRDRHHTAHRYSDRIGL